MMVASQNMMLRSVKDDDHDWLIQLHNDPLVLRNLTHPEPITATQHHVWWDRVRNDPKQLRLVFEVDGRRAGFTKFYDIDMVNSNCVLGADLHVDFRGQGLAKHMWDLMLSLAFDHYGLNRVSLTTAEFNEVAQRVYRKLGFKVEGHLYQSLYRDGRYWDQVCMYMLHSDWEMCQNKSMGVQV